jgi:hypothetical protein
MITIDNSLSELPGFDIFDVEANRKNILPVGKAIIADDGACKLVAHVGSVRIPGKGKPVYTVYHYPLFSGLHCEMPDPLRAITDIVRSTNPETRIVGYHLAPDNMDKPPQTASIEMELCRKIHRLWLRAAGARKTVNSA